MSEQITGSFYGVKTATVADLVGMVEGGNDLARDELRVRLRPQLLDLVRLYLVAYGPDDAGKVLADDLASFKIQA